MDLDNDGDLDLVVNNLGGAASVYQNTAAERGATSLRITLQGEGANTGGVGARVTVRADSAGTQTAEAFPTRGYLSSVDPRLVVGLGGAARAARVQVTWPDGRVQTLTDVPAGALTLRQADAGPPGEAPAPPRPARLFEDVTAQSGLGGWRHVENVFVDFNRERLMPHKLSTEGPALAVGDVDGDGLDDVFVGGARGQASVLFVQTAAGFVQTENGPWEADKEGEDVAATFFDADGDGDLDLYVGTAGNEFRGRNEALRDRLYLNGGAGRFQRAPRGALPGLFVHTGTVAAEDWDGDGDTDLFVGGRVVPRAYGRPAPSALLENDGAGRFRDVTERRAPGLARVGMVSRAAWADLDGDGRRDLVVVGEWMAPTAFRATGRGLEPMPLGLDDATGRWTALDVADLDGDGDADLVLGNLGLNSRLRASADHPARLLLADFDENGQEDALLTTWRDGADYPVATVALLQQQFPELRQRFPTATAFGARTPEDLFGGRARGADKLEATTFASAVALNDGAGRFTLRPLPRVAQVEPVYAALAGDRRRRRPGGPAPGRRPAGRPPGRGPLRRRPRAPAPGRGGRLRAGQPRRRARARRRGPQPGLGPPAGRVAVARDRGVGRPAPSFFGGRGGDRRAAVRASGGRPGRGRGGAVCRESQACPPRPSFPRTRESRVASMEAGGAQNGQGVPRSTSTSVAPAA